jgi:hypothetical protein
MLLQYNEVLLKKGRDVIVTRDGLISVRQKESGGPAICEERAVEWRDLADLLVPWHDAQCLTVPWPRLASFRLRLIPLSF